MGFGLSSIKIGLNFTANEYNYLKNISDSETFFY